MINMCEIVANKNMESKRVGQLISAGYFRCIDIHMALFTFYIIHLEKLHSFIRLSSFWCYRKYYELHSGLRKQALLSRARIYTKCLPA